MAAKIFSWANDMLLLVLIAVHVRACDGIEDCFAALKFCAFCVLSQDMLDIMDLGRGGGSRRAPHHKTRWL